MISYLHGLIATSVFLATLTVLTGCGAAPLAPTPGDSGSLTTSVDDVSSDLRTKVKIAFKLFCSTDKGKLSSATPTVVVDDASIKDTISFPAVKAVEGDWCALEVAANEPDKVPDGVYTWNSKPAQKGLFYATTPAQLDKARHLALTMHKLYAGGVASDAAAAVSVAVTNGTACDWDGVKHDCATSPAATATATATTAVAPTSADALVGHWVSACTPLGDGSFVGMSYTFGADKTFAVNRTTFKNAACNAIGKSEDHHGTFAAATAARTDGSLALTLQVGKGPAQYMLVSIQDDALFVSSWQPTAPDAAAVVDRGFALPREMDAGVF